MAPPRKIPTPTDIPNPSGRCQCGCGRIAPVALKSGHGNYAGYHVRFCHGHNRRCRPAYLGPQLCKCGCGRLVYFDTTHGRLAEYCRGHHMRTRPASGPHAPSWRGGRSLTTQGYISIYRPGHPLCDASGYGLEHRIVLYDAGYRFRPGDVTHHVNGDRTDNRLENLRVLTIADHLRLHRRQPHEHRQ